MKRRLPKLIHQLPICLAVIYVVRGLYLFFGSLGTEGHEWWPLFFYKIIWPMSVLLEFLDNSVLNLFIANPQSAPDWSWALNDYVMGTLYIFGGGAWVWAWGKMILRLVTRFFPKHANEHAA